MIHLHNRAEGAATNIGVLRNPYNLRMYREDYGRVPCLLKELKSILCPQIFVNYGHLVVLAHFKYILTFHKEYSALAQ
jgi:hypothetical protein